MVVRFFLLLSAVFFFGCSHGSYWATTAGENVRQCNFPILFGVSSNVNVRDTKALAAGVQYWNVFFKQKAFVYIGVLPFEPEPDGTLGVLTIDAPKEYTRKGCGVARFTWDDETGCMRKAIIDFNQACLNRHEASYIESLGRHEAGHILGLRHSKVKGSLMYRQLGLSKPHPRDSSSEEIELLRALYK